MGKEAQPEFAEFGVNVSASLACPPGTEVVPDRECAIRLPTGQTLKFWVCAELVDDENDVYQDLSTDELRALGVYLEHDGGAVVPK